MDTRVGGLYIGGKLRPIDNTFEVLNPATGAVYGAAPDAGRVETRDAIDAAQSAFAPWAALIHEERARVLFKAAELLEQRIDEYAQALVAESGSWIGKAMFEVGLAATTLRTAGALAYSTIGEVLPSTGNTSLAVRQAMGVIAVISPWNFPLALSVRGIAYPLAAGNTVVLKPSEETPATGGLLLAKIFAQAGIPDGVLNVVTCSRGKVAEVGDELVANPRVKGVSFTGSTAVGREIAIQAAGLFKKCCTELGGKDALIVLDDADMERATGAANFGAFMHQGQICMSVERVLVQKSIAAEFTRQFVQRAGSLQTGDPALSPDNIIGPIINQRQLAKIEEQLADAIAKGATVELGGRIKGPYVEPTILSGVTVDMKVFQEETFGPVAPIITFENDADAIALANNSDYGLSSAVVTSNEARGLKIARRLETGMCHINASTVADQAINPFGGEKNSGVGRQGGRWAMEAFTTTRWITLDRTNQPFPF